VTAAADYVGAYPFLEERRHVWREIARYVQRDAPAAQSVVELGPGYCDFINEFRAPRKLAFDLNPEMAEFAAPEVDLRVGPAHNLASLGEGSVDLVFASNFFEHLEKDEAHELFAIVREVLSERGRLVLLQPNHRLCAANYFDDPTHKTIFDDKSIREDLASQGLKARRVVAGLLPFSMKSRLPKWPLLVRLYLHSPIRPLAAQMYVVAERA